MERQFVYCPKCDDIMEAEYEKGRWFCENCGHNLTKEVELNIERELAFNRKQSRRNK